MEIRLLLYRPNLFVPNISYHVGDKSVDDIVSEKFCFSPQLAIKSLYTNGSQRMGFHYYVNLDSKKHITFITNISRNSYYKYFQFKLMYNVFIQIKALRIMQSTWCSYIWKFVKRYSFKNCLSPQYSHISI